MNGYSLWRSKEAKRGGYSGLPAILPGDSAGSRLIHLVAGLEENLVMPPTGGRVTNEKIAILRAWIDQGAKWSRRPNESKREAEQPWLHMDYGPVISAAFTVREPEDPRADRAPGDNVAYKGHAIVLNEEKSAARSLRHRAAALRRRLDRRLPGLHRHGLRLEAWAAPLCRR